MTPKVNLKAKIERHSRILKDNILQTKKIKNNYSLSYKIVLLIVIVVFPFYPTFASLIYNNSVTDFYRWDIDESSIISSYQEVADNNQESITIFESDDWNFLSVNTIWESDRDLEWTNEIITYEVKPWESIDSIASKFWVSRNSVYRANNFEYWKVIHPWNKIKIPPVSWLIYKVKKWDTIEAIAKEFNIDLEKILKQNLMTRDSTLIAWNDIVIPWAKPKPVIVEQKKTLAKNTTNNSKTKTNTKKSSTPSSSEYVEDSWEYSLTKRTPKRSFVWWNCTRYVAQYKNVTWWGNANAWLRNAKSAWVETWSKPVAWAIIVFNWRWYNPRYWHVWIVTSVNSDHIIIKDMNYRALNEVTVRKISKNDWAIKWYIYAD